MSLNQKYIERKNNIKALPKQYTILNPISFAGHGVHSGKKTTIKIYPNEVDTGYVFQRTDIKSSPIYGRYDNVTSTNMSTIISNSDGVCISTVEHLLAALYGMGVSNAYIEVDGPEIPIMDGSSYEFAKKIKEIGVKKQSPYIEVLFVKKKFTYSDQNSKITVLPASTPQLIVQFDGYNRMDELLTKKYTQFRPFEECFFEKISNARTFGFYSDALELQKKGYAKGASLENTIAIDDNKVLNPEGLRSSDEFVRHKLLDMIGDFALSGVHIIGGIIAHNTNHTFNNKFLHKFMHAYDYWD